MAKVESVNTGMRLGIVTGAEPVWVMVPTEGPLRFTCGRTGQSADFLPGEGIITRHVVVGVSAREMTFRRTSLPFSRPEKIRAVLFQEALDTLLVKPDRLQVAFRAKKTDEGTEVFYAVADRDVLAGHLRHLNRWLPGGPGGLVVAELGAWPLLTELGTISGDEPVLVVDGSASPVALFVVSSGGVESVRLVSEKTAALGAGAVTSEVAWLADDLLRQSDTCRKVICLGSDSVLYRDKLARQGKAAVVVLPLDQLGEGLAGWPMLRAAGLAVAARNRNSRQLLDLLQGDFAGFDRPLAWMIPWRPAIVLLAAVAVAGFLQLGFRYVFLGREADRLQVEIEQTFRQALPGVPAIVEPRRQLQQALQAASLSAGGGSLALSQWIAVIQARTPRDLALQWRQLRYEKAGIELFGEVASYDELNRLQISLAGEEKNLQIDVEEAQLNTEKKRVQFKLRLASI